MAWAAVQVAVGGILLAVGADFLVRGAANLALRMGVSALAVGLTVVAYGTSAPELVVSTCAAWNGRSDMAMGNVIGSNIANIGLILAISACVRPIPCNAGVVFREIPIMVVVSLLLAVLVLTGSPPGGEGTAGHQLTRPQGALLIALSIVYTVLVYWMGRREGRLANAEGTSPPATPTHAWTWDAGIVLAGLFLLAWGANWLVDGATVIARLFGVSELVIGLTLVAIGTSLPELATSGLAALRGQSEIALGNVVGSCIFNVLLVLGATATICPISVNSLILWRDIPIAILFAIACVPIAATGRIVTRGEGLILLAGYIGYVVILTW